MVSDPQNPKCLTDALFRHHRREKRPDGNPKIDETDIHMMIQESIGAGWLTVTHIFQVFLESEVGWWVDG